AAYNNRGLLRFEKLSDFKGAESDLAKAISLQSDYAEAWGLLAEARQQQGKDGGTQIKKAQEAVLLAGQYAYNGRKLKKRDIRSLWIVRLNAAARNNGTTYKSLIHSLKEKNIALDRKILSQIAVEYPAVFGKMIEQMK
ncbi:50S ribosomal protein L20, partial [Candidatus Roizmanbacteria bacterium]|nr:50S ribosomal protein L20 [Candidatus Roizmanbacteria bacterium]